jgi:deoxyribose-phosphate aldolase
MLITKEHRFASMIDHTLLKAEATTEQVRKLCDEAHTYHFASVCVNPIYVQFAAESLENSAVNVCTVIGFPLGANTTSTKVFEAALAIQQGATELDMVLNIGALSEGNFAVVESDIRAVVDVAHRSGTVGVLVKVIVETALLSNAQKIAACEIVSRSGADFIKTSTGFAASGASVADVLLMKEHTSPLLQIKASGGIRTLAFARELIAAGATRLGMSAGADIMQAMTTSLSSPSSSSASY